jgi:hypothetical protein
MEIKKEKTLHGLTYLSVWRSDPVALYHWQLEVYTPSSGSSSMSSA